MKRVILGSAIFFFLLTSLFLIPAVSTASAHSATHFRPLAPCQQDQCNGKDPSNTGCVAGEILRWYAYIYDNQSRPIGRVEQWYSPACNAIWTNVQTLNNVNSSYLIALIQRSLDGNYQSSNEYYNRQNVHTPMLGFWGNTCYTSKGNMPGAKDSPTVFQHCYKG